MDHRTRSVICVFQHVRNRRLHLRFVPSRRLRVERDLFLNLGRVQNLSVEVDHDAASAEDDNSAAGGPSGFDPLNLGRIFAAMDILIVSLYDRS